jgi:hypothetical protein
LTRATVGHGIVIDDAHDSLKKESDFFPAWTMKTSHLQDLRETNNDFIIGEGSLNYAIPENSPYRVMSSVVVFHAFVQWLYVSF